ncbi:MAG: DUF374 domain-containing protein [Acetobacteraceae bacterium]|nr:DUF374 domain-containing protein [Acetobacteraceae bacterium]
MARPVRATRRGTVLEWVARQAVPRREGRFDQFGKCSNMMNMKPLLRSGPVQHFLAWLISRYLRLILYTNRWTLDGADHFAPHRAGKPAIYTFWHEFLPLMPALPMLARRFPDYVPTPLSTLVSQHRDGRLIGTVVRHFGIKPVHGSTSRGGANGVRRLLGLLRRGASIGITPDGPRGPKREAAQGVAQLAALSGVPILPCAVRTSRRVVLNTWDRMAIPLPFGRGVVVCEPAIAVSRDRWREALPIVTAALNQAADRADRLCDKDAF